MNWQSMRPSSRPAIRNQFGSVKRMTEDEVRKIVGEAVAKERRDIEVRLIEQEHRPTHVAFNLFNHARDRDEELKRAAWRAALWRLFTPRLATTSVVTAGLFTMLLTVLGLAIGIRANALLERQNARMDVQNLLSESQRRSSFLASELASILSSSDWPKAEPRKPGEASQINHSQANLRMPDGALGRILSLTMALGPYRPVSAARTEQTSIKRPSRPEQSLFGGYLEKFGEYFFPLTPELNLYEIHERLISPERGQLLMALSSQNVQMESLAKRGADFEYADLSNAVLTDTNLKGLRLKYADFDKAVIFGVVLSEADLSYATFDEATLIDVAMDSVRTTGMRFSGVTIRDNFSFSKGARSKEQCIVRNTNAMEFKGEDGAVNGLVGLLACQLEGLMVTEEIAETLASEARARSFSFIACRTAPYGKPVSVSFYEPGSCPPDSTAVFQQAAPPSP